MRWLYVPNENTEGDQIGPRMAFEKLQQEGFFSAYAVYSYLVRGTAVNCHQEALNEFIESARAFAPDVIFIQHPSNGYPMDRAWLRQLKSIASKPKLVLFEADAYGHVIKKMDATLRAVIAETDMCFFVGMGSMAEMALDAGAQKVRFAPHSYDSQRYGTSWTQH